MDQSKYIPIINDLIWPQLNHFNIRENWGDYRRIDIRLLWGLDRVRRDLGRKIHINCAYEESGHAEKSFHKIGMAVDFVVAPLDKNNALDMYSLYTTILSMWHGGVGVYPFWNTPGLHLDLGEDRTWVRDKDGVYHSDSGKIYNILVSENL